MTAEKLVGETVFRDILEKASSCWKSVPDPAFLKRFVEYALRFTNSSTQRFRWALDELARTSESFPSIADLEKAVARSPRGPIEYMHKLDSRLTCNYCSSSGLQRLIEPSTQYEVYGYCPCQIGHYISKFGTKGVLSVEQLRSKGFVTVKEYRRSK